MIPRVRRAVASTLLAASLITLDAAADPAIAYPDNALSCEIGVIYRMPPK